MAGELGMVKGMEKGEDSDARQTELRSLPRRSAAVGRVASYSTCLGLRFPGFGDAPPSQGLTANVVLRAAAGTWQMALLATRTPHPVERGCDLSLAPSLLVRELEATGKDSFSPRSSVPRLLGENPTLHLSDQSARWARPCRRAASQIPQIPPLLGTARTAWTFRQARGPALPLAGKHNGAT